MKNKIFIQNKKGELKQVCLREVIADAMKSSDEFYSKFSVEIDSFEDKEDSSWIELNKEIDDKKMAIILMFDHNGDIIEEINVFETPIKKIEDTDNTKKLI